MLWRSRCSDSRVGLTTLSEASLCAGACDLTRWLTVPSLGGDDECTVCNSWTDRLHGMCTTCHLAASALGRLAPVIPISLYRRPSPLRDWLSFYKPGRPILVTEYGDLLSRILRQFLSAQTSNLWRHVGGWTDVAVVPSSRREPPHALEAVVERAGLTLTRDVLTSTGVMAQHRIYDDKMFHCRDMERRRVLLVEDVYVSGARSQSAAAVLREGGAEVAGVLVLGRRINPDYSVEMALFWASRAAISFGFAESFSWRTGRKSIAYA